MGLDYDPQGSRYDSSSPAYDHRWEYAVEAEMETGAAILRHKPAALLALIARICGEADFDDAAAELLAPIFASDSPGLAELRASLMRDDYSEFFGIACDALIEEHK